MGAAADCELIRAGFLGQPVNAITSLGFVLGGVVVASRRQNRRWVGIALAATGVGSFLFHGPMPPGNEWAHDVTIAWLLVVVAAAGTRAESYSHLPALAVLGVGFALAPAWGDPIAVALTVVAIVSVLRSRDRHALLPLSLLALVAIYGRLGATGGPFCDPESVFQPHGVWHLGSALAVTWWALSDVSRPRADSPSPAPSR
ncbi:MAG TPA: hypothetical protein VFV13_10475 [Acidimicrobiia bacterium]|nr:hypothetical protein [Acidimicrobiia bacterium]